MALHVRDSEKRTYDYFLSCASHRLAGPFGKVDTLMSSVLRYQTDNQEGILERIYPAIGSCGTACNRLSTRNLDSV